MTENPRDIEMHRMVDEAIKPIVEAVTELTRTMSQYTDQLARYIRQQS